MDDTALKADTHVSLDFQSHLAELEARGLLVRIDREINKDTELHPLVRCQFLGGIPEDERRAFLFTNVVDSAGRRYDIPVVVGAFAASPKIYAIGMGRAVGDIGADWLHAIDNPIASGRGHCGSLPEVVIQGEDLRRAGGGLAALPVPISTPGFDAAPYLTATLCITADPDSGVRNIGTYRAALKSTDRFGRAHVLTYRGCRRLSSLVQIPRAQGANAMRHRHRRGARDHVHRSRKARDRSGRAVSGRCARGDRDSDDEGSDGRSGDSRRCGDRLSKA